MNKYSDMTDFEINRRLAIALGFDCCNSHHPKNESGVIIVGNSTSIKNGVDYCNDWGAIGPIIEANGIDLGVLVSGDWIARHPVPAYGPDHRNPKRAAAICFLMMKEVE